MKRRLLSLVLVLVLVFAGCTNNGVETPQSNSTTGPQTVAPSTDAVVDPTGASAPSVADSTENSSQKPTATGQSQSASSSATGSTAGSVSSSVSVSGTTPSSTNTQVTFKVTIRENIKAQVLPGVMVTVFAGNSSTPLGSGITDQKGVAVFLLAKEEPSYRVMLSQIPSGYEAKKEYVFTTNAVNIILQKAAVRNELDHSGAQYKKGDTMTDFSLTDTNGNTHQLSQLTEKKKLIILNFWFVDCAPCNMEFPFLEKAWQKHTDDIALLAINSVDSAKTIASFAKRNNLTFPMLWDACKLTVGFGINEFPTTVFIDANGRILAIHTAAYHSESEALAAIERYL